ncbi:tetratricopeptide repeat-containing sulfotransferase family protein [Paraglaciecola arctica]|uniref:tetratricopeptide repeat-containing sulfotransferase family protein n=1 Tax=Paraglaciecola arctica TaxID=1128911 RepID=UPI001C076819|nr:sulfotransferase [Paraglaciecola arctica]MBU3003305.1 sulfotransferase [Paraglaciecola arctica]
MNDVKNILNNLVSAVKVGDSHKAYDCLALLLSEKPNLNASWLGVARMALLSGQVTSARKALALFEANAQKPFADRLQQLAMLIESGQVQLAFEKALELATENPNRPEIYHFLSTVAMQLGKKEMAIEYAELVLKQWNTSGQTWLILASLEKASQGSSILRRLLEVKNSIDETANQASKSCFYAALCKVYFDLTDFEKAFEYASKANDYLLKIQTYPITDDSQNVRYIASQHSSFVDTSPTKRKVDADNPIFVVGLPRSGTSLLEQMLCSHSNIIDGGEFNGMERASRCLTKGLAIGSRAEQLDVNVVEKHTQEIRRAYLQYAHEKFGSEGVVVDKSMTNNRYIWLIKKVFPDSPIIFIKRNTLDTAWSCYRTHFSSGFSWSTSLENMGEYFSLEEDLNRLWLQKFKSSILQISYQNLVEQPQALLQEVCEFCGLEFENSMLHFYESKRAVFTASVAQVREEVHQEAIGFGKKIERELKPFIEHYRY